MPKIHRKVGNKIGLDKAKSVMSGIVDQLESNYGSYINEIKWNEDKTRADFSGKLVSGFAHVSEEHVELDLDLSFMAKPFMGKIEEHVDEGLKEFGE